MTARSVPRITPDRDVEIVAALTANLRDLIAADSSPARCS
jgi:hypothetical protein